MKTLLSVGDLIDTSWDLFQKQFRTLLPISGWFLVSALLSTIALFLYPSSRVLAFHTTLTQGESFGVILYAVSTLILSPIIGFWIYITLARAGYKLIKNQPIQTTTLLQETKRYIVPVALVVVLVAVMLVWAQIMSVGPAVLLGAIAFWIKNTPLIILANLLLVVGLFVSLYFTTEWTVYYYYSPLASILDGSQKMEALKKSRSLIEGRFWGVLLRIIVPKLVFIGCMAFFIVLISMAVNLMIETFAGLNADLYDRWTMVANTLLPLISMMLIYPLLIISDVLLYQNLKGEVTS